MNFYPNPDWLAHSQGHELWQIPIIKATCNATKEVDTVAESITSMRINAEKGYSESSDTPTWSSDGPRWSYSI
jgi:hypothetical protein